MDRKSPEPIVRWLASKKLRVGGASPYEVIRHEGSTGAIRVAYELEQLKLGSDKVVKQARGKHQPAKRPSGS